MFDVCSKIDGPTLDDCLYPGYLLAETLISFSLRFCANQIVFMTDIEKVFLQIPLKHEHRDFALFLWYENENETNSENI